MLRHRALLALVIALGLFLPPLATPAFALTPAEVDKAQSLISEEKEYTANLANAKNPAAMLEILLYLPSKNGSNADGCRYQISTHINDGWYCESADLPYQPVLPSVIADLEAHLAIVKAELAKLGIVEGKP